MAFGDVLAGLAEAGHQYRNTLLQLDSQKRKELADTYGKLAEDQNYPEDARTEFLHRAVQIHTMPTEKKLPKEWENMTVQVKPSAPAPVSIPETEGTSGPNAGMIPAGSDQLAPVGIEHRNVQPPTPPPYSQSVFAPLSFDERMSRQGQSNAVDFDTKVAPSERLKLSKPIPTGVKGVESDAAGNTFMVNQMHFMDPETGKWTTYNQKSDYPLRKFAPRASGEINIEDASSLHAQDPSMLFMDEATGRPIDFEALMKAVPDATLRHTGSGQYQINSRKYDVFHVGGEVVARPASGAPTQDNTVPLGIQNPGSQAVSARPVGVDANQNVVIADLPSSRTPIVTGMTGGAKAPVAPPVPGAAPGVSPSGGVAQPTVATPKPQASVQSPAAPRTAGGTRTLPGVMPSSAVNQQRQIAMPIREVARSLIADPSNPSAPSLENYAHFAMDPKARNEIGTAVDMILRGSADKNGGEAGILGEIPLVGDMLSWIRRQGITEKLSSAQVDSIQRVLSNPEQAQAVHQIIATYGVIPGLRVATKGSAYQFYVKNLENEIPTFGNITSAGQFYEKMAILSRDVVNAVFKGIDPSIMSQEEKQNYVDAETRYWKLSRLSDKEIRTAEISGPNVRYRKGGTGDVTIAPGSTPPKAPPKKEPK